MKSVTAGNLRHSFFKPCASRLQFLRQKLLTNFMEFKDLNEIYIQLENGVESIKRVSEQTDLMRKLADKTTDADYKEKIIWESFVFDFCLDNGDVKSIHSSTKENGVTIFTYPSFEDFGNKGLNYLKKRAKEVKSDFLLSRYNHILWNSPAPHKHEEYAKVATDAYIRILKKFESIKDDGWDILCIMKNAFKVAAQAKYRIDDLKGILKSWLFEEGKFPEETKVLVLQFMLDSPQFKKPDFDDTLLLLEKIGTIHAEKVTDYFLSKEIYETGLKIAQRTGSDVKIWNERLGDAIVKMADHRMDDKTRIVPLDFLKEAIPYYKNAGATEKVKQAEQRFFELKKELKLSKVEIPLSDKAAEELTNYFSAKTEKLLEQTPEDIFGYLLSGVDIFPKRNWLVEMARNRKDGFLDFARTVRFDINNNISGSNDHENVKDNEKVFENYHLYMSLAVLPFLHRIFIEGIKKEKITFENLIKFLFNHTWLGQELTDYDSAGDVIKYNWLSVIAPSIHEYFVQTESALKSRNPYTNYVMPVDSLTLKFEGVLRDFASLLGMSTTIAGKGNVLREKYIEEFLGDETFQKYFDEDDVLFFNFLFVAKGGMNLRNNIAHCFYRFNNYSFQIMHLLICAFLRIGKYRVKSKNKGDQEAMS